MSAPARPTQGTRPGSQTQRPQGRPWWRLPLALAVLLCLAGLVWAGYAIWFALSHVRASHARVTGLVVNIAAKDDTRVQQVVVRTGEEVTKGQIVALLDKDSLQAEVERAEATLSAVESELARADRALELTIRESAASVEEADAQLSAARSRLRQSEAEMQMQAQQQPDEVRKAAADLNAARSRLADTAVTLRRMERLQAQGAVSEQQLDQARIAQETAQANVEAAEAALAVAQAADHQARIRQHAVATRAAEELQAAASLKSARTQTHRVTLAEQEVLVQRAEVAQAQAALESARARLSDAVLRSPATGVTIKGPGRSVKDGEVVQKGEPIVTVLATDVPFWINASVSELYSGRVREGQPVRIRVDSLRRGVFRRQWLTGKVDKVGAATEFQASEASPWMVQQVPIRIAFDTRGLPVKHGTTCRVWIDVKD